MGSGRRVKHEVSFLPYCTCPRAGETQLLFKAAFLLRAFETGNQWRAEIKWDDQLSFLQNSRKWPSGSATHQGCTPHSSAVPSPIFQLHLGTSLLQGSQSGATLSFRVFGPFSGTDGEKYTPGALREALGAGRSVGARGWGAGLSSTARLGENGARRRTRTWRCPGNRPTVGGAPRGAGVVARRQPRRRQGQALHAAPARGPCPRPRSLCPPWRWRMSSVSLGRVEGGGGLAPLSVCFPPGSSLPS